MSTQFQLGIDRHAELDEQITRVLRRADLDESTAELLRLLAGHKGAANALSISKILHSLNDGISEYALDPKFGVGWSDRTVKSAVKDLIERFGIPIGGSRHTPCGYFLILTADDQEHAARPLRNELKSLSRRLRALSSKQDLARLFGQVQLELDREDGGKAA